MQKIWAAQSHQPQSYFSYDGIWSHYQGRDQWFTSSRTCCQGPRFLGCFNELSSSRLCVQVLVLPSPPCTYLLYILNQIPWWLNNVLANCLPKVNCSVYIIHPLKRRHCYRVWKGQPQDGVDSTRTPPGLHQDSPRTPPGLSQDSARTPPGLHQDSPRTPPGLHQDSPRTPPGVPQNSATWCNDKS